MKIREYSGPLTVLAAGVLGFSLICIVSAAALGNPGTTDVSDLGAREIVNSAFSNPISTAVAMTAVEISEYIPTPTPTFTGTFTPPPTEITYITPTRPFVTWTPAPPTRTRMGRFTPIPSRVPSTTPTKPPAPTSTDTRVPTFTFTPRPPPTDTPVPTNTSQPTDTPEPPTDTPEPPPDTPVPDSPTPPGAALPEFQP